MKFEWATRAASLPWMTWGRRESYRELAEKTGEQRERFALWPSPPLVSLVLDGLSAERGELRETVASLLAQSYPNWELLIVVDGNESLPRDVVDPSGDPRIRWIEISPLSGPVWAKNWAAESATGAWVGFPTPGKIYSPAMLYLLMRAAARHAGTSLVYANEVELDPSGSKAITLISKPDFNAFDLWHGNFIGEPWLLERERFQTARGFRVDTGEAHEHDLLLRVAEVASPTLVPAYLAYGRSRSEVGPDSARVVARYLSETGREARVQRVLRDGVDRLLIQPPLNEPGGQGVTAIICFRDRAEMTLTSARALAAAARTVPLSLVLVDNGSSAEERSIVEKGSASLGVPVRILHFGGAFNFAHLNELAAQLDGESRYLLLVNNDVFWRAGDSLDELVAWASQTGVGSVGVPLLYENGAVQHGGMRAWAGEGERLVRVGPEQGERGAEVSLRTRTVFANTFAACLIPRHVFRSVGGLRPLDMPNGFGDVAFCFTALEQGYRHLFLANFGAIHLESASRGVRYEYWEEAEIEAEFPHLLARMLRRDMRRVRILPSNLGAKLGGLLRAQVRERAPWVIDGVRGLRNGVRAARRTSGEFLSGHIEVGEGR